MKKFSLLFLSGFFAVLLAQAQPMDSLVKQSRFIKSFRVNVNYNHYYDSYGVSYGYYGYYNNWKDPKDEIGNMGLGYTLKSRKNFNSHDFELSNAGFTKSKDNNSGYKYYLSQQSLSLRYQFNYFFIKRNNVLFSPYLGASYAIRFLRNRYVSIHDQYQYHDTDLDFSDQVSIVPGLQLRVSPRIYFDLSIPINIFRGSFSQRLEKEYPQFNTTRKFADQFSFFKKDYYQLRLGMGLILNPDKQENKENGKYIKSFKVNIYQRNFFYKNFNNTGFDLNGLAPVVAFQNRLTRNMHEIEFTDLTGLFENSENHFSMSSRYQFDYFFIKKPSLLAPYLGVSALLNYRKSLDYNYNTPTLKYYHRQSYFNYILGAVPGIQLNPCNQFYLDFSLPIDIWTGGYGKTKTDDPSRQEVNSSGFYGDYAKRYHNWNIRIGLGFRL